MWLDLTHLPHLTPAHLCILVTGCRALWAEDRYAAVTIVAHRQVCSQIRLFTRWADREDKTGKPDPRLDVVSLVEVPS